MKSPRGVIQSYPQNGSNGHRVRICIGSISYYGPFRKTREAAARDLWALRGEDSASKKKELLHNLIIEARDFRCRKECRGRGAGGEAVAEEIGRPLEGEAELLLSASEDAKKEDVEGDVEMTLEDEAKRGLEDVGRGRRGCGRQWKTLRPQANEAGREEVQGDGEMTLEDEQLRPQVNGDGGKAELARAQTNSSGSASATKASRANM